MMGGIRGLEGWSPKVRLCRADGWVLVHRLEVSEEGFVAFVVGETSVVLLGRHHRSRVVLLRVGLVVGLALEAGDVWDPGWLVPGRLVVVGDFGCHTGVGQGLPRMWRRAVSGS